MEQTTASRLRIETLQAKVDALLKERLDLQQQLSSVQSALAKSEKLSADVQHRLASTKQALEESQRMNSGLQEAVLAASAQMTAIEDHLRDLEQQAMEAKLQSSRYKAEVSHLTSLLQQAQVCMFGGMNNSSAIYISWYRSLIPLHLPNKLRMSLRIFRKFSQRRTLTRNPGYKHHFLLHGRR